jgi:hypothetical protein
VPQVRTVLASLGPFGLRVPVSTSCLDEEGFGGFGRFGGFKNPGFKGRRGRRGQPELSDFLRGSIATRFVYFGKQKIDVGRQFADFVPQARSYCYVDGIRVDAFVNWVFSHGSGIKGRPHNPLLPLHRLISR